MEPFVLTNARPDYKRPYVSTTYGIGLENAKKELYDDFWQYIYSNYEEVKSGGYNSYVDNYYCDSYMENEPYELKVFDLEKKEWIDYSDLIEEVFNEVFMECSLELECEENEDNNDDE